MGSRVCQRARETRSRVRLAGSWGETELQIDFEELLKEEWSDCDFDDRVPGMRDDAGWNIQPVVAKTANRFLLPLGSEVLAFQKLHQRERQNTNGEVETVG